MPEFGGHNVQYKVVDPYTGEDLPEESVGELTVRGNLVTRGYYKKPDETHAVIDKDGWLRSGDLGRINENGYIEFLGRSKEVYKVFGENVSPREIEDVITKHPAVKRAYVVGVSDSMTTEAGAAFIELRAGQTATRREIINWCQERLAKFKIPRHVWFVEEKDWPMTGTGKIQKFLLQKVGLKRNLNTPKQPSKSPASQITRSCVMSGEKRIAVTGLGAATPFGLGVNTFWSALVNWPFGCPSNNGRATRALCTRDCIAA